MSNRRLLLLKIIALCILGIVLIIAGFDFYRHRNYKEAVVMGSGVTELKRLSDYFKPLEGTVADCNIYILDSGKPGGTLMLLGGSHPEEPASNLAAQVFVENAMVEQGKLVVVLRANRSASTVTRPGDAYPQFYHISTDWGTKKYRMGDRWSNPLDSWPDPEVYVNYPSKQLLAYMDIRNLNRTWPGKANGSITEQIAYAFTKVIEAEKVDLFIDYHEAELEYPVISTIVAHEKATSVACMAAMVLSDEEFNRPIGMEYSPKALHGLSHREVGDHTEAASLLFETPQPFLDRVRGKTDEELLLTGKDEFVMTAGKHGLLYEQIDENGWSIDVRVGRHCSSTLEVINVWSEMTPGKELIVTNVPRYAEIIENKLGHYFHNPDEVSKELVAFE